MIICDPCQRNDHDRCEWYRCDHEHGQPRELSAADLAWLSDRDAYMAEHYPLEDRTEGEKP